MRNTEQTELKSLKGEIESLRREVHNLKLSKILSRNRKQIDGLTFLTDVPSTNIAFTSGTDINTIRVEGERFLVESADSSYNDQIHSQNYYSVERIAREIIFGMKSYFPKQVYEDRVNRFIKDIKERTKEELNRNILTY